MRSLAIFTLCLGSLSAHAEVAKFGGGAALGGGPVIIHAAGATPQKMGYRGELTASFFDIGFEHYGLADETRIRMEFGFHVPIRIGTRIGIEPQLGFMPLDYTAEKDGSLAFAISATAGVRLYLRLFFGVSLLVEPIRMESSLLRLSIPSSDELPAWNREQTVFYSSSAGLAYRW